MIVAARLALTVLWAAGCAGGAGSAHAEHIAGSSAPGGEVVAERPPIDSPVTASSGVADSGSDAAASAAPGQPAPSSAPPSPQPPLTNDAGMLVVGFVSDQSMMHTQLGVVVWRGARRERVFDAGRYVGPCSAETYVTLAPPARQRNIVVALGCDGRGVAAGALAIVEIAREGEQLVVRTADVRVAGRRVGRGRVIRRVPLDGATQVRAATVAETTVVRAETPSW
ncbi:MAG: hypothetical protein WCJ30_22170 [Deltaproteobacteria bacterium]